MGEGMLYELRHYIPCPGKEDLLRTRFEHTIAVFTRLGFRVLGFWLAVDRPGEIWYMLEWSGPAERDEGWQRLRDDEEWKRIKAASEASGPLIQHIDSIKLTPGLSTFE